jgi:hypothetical protein
VIAATRSFRLRSMLIAPRPFFVRAGWLVD